MASLKKHASRMTPSSSPMIAARQQGMAGRPKRASPQSSHSASNAACRPSRTWVSVKSRDVLGFAHSAFKDGR